MDDTGRNPKLERRLYQGGWIVGDAIGWVINRIFADFSKAKGERNKRGAKAE